MLCLLMSWQLQRLPGTIHFINFITNDRDKSKGKSAGIHFQITPRSNYHSENYSKLHWMPIHLQVCPFAIIPFQLGSRWM